MGMGPIRQAALAAGTNKASPPPSASGTTEKPNQPTGMSGTSPGEQSRRPDIGTKQAQIGKASGYTPRSFLPGRCPLTCIAA